MKNIILATVALFVSTSSFADTYSEKTAKEMVSVLQSKEISELLVQEDGFGNIRGIEYKMSGRASFGPSVYEVSFESNSGPFPQICSVSAQVNVQTLQVLSISKASCREIK